MPDTLTRTTPMYREVGQGDYGSPQAFTSAFEFLQRHGESRYSDRTLMSINRLAASSAAILDGSAPYADRPARVFICGSEVTYDEETEVKRGGTLAVAVCLPVEQGFKVVMATAPEARRQRLATSLMDMVRRGTRGSTCWVGQNNIEGQQFLLSVGMFPLAMNNRNAVLYGWRQLEEDEGVAR